MLHADEVIERLESERARFASKTGNGAWQNARHHGRSIAQVVAMRSQKIFDDSLTEIGFTIFGVEANWPDSLAIDD